MDDSRNPFARRTIRDGNLRCGILPPRSRIHQDGVKIAPRSLRHLQLDVDLLEVVALLFEVGARERVAI